MTFFGSTHISIRHLIVSALALAVLPLHASATPVSEVRLNAATGSATATTARLDIVLESNNFVVGGMQNDLLFDNRVLQLPRVSACRINPEIGDRLLACEEDEITEPCKSLGRSLKNCGDDPLPDGCPANDANLSLFRGIVAAFAIPNEIPIPDGSILYSCDFELLDPDALPGTITSTNLVASNPSGVRLPAAAEQIFEFPSAAPPTATATPDIPPTDTPTQAIPSTPTPTETPTQVVAATETPTSTPVPGTFTPSATATAPATASPSPSPASTATATGTPGVTITRKSGGCHVVAPSQSGESAAWLLLVIGVVMRVRRPSRDS